MPNATWPAGLPQDVEIDGYEETSPANKLRTQMDAGPAKQRRRFTAGVRPLKVTMIMTRAQIATLDAFHDATLAGGALPFDFTHPRTLVTTTFSFVKEPMWRPLSATTWRAAMEWEILP